VQKEQTSTAGHPRAVGVELKNISFGYSHMRPACLQDINLQIHPGQVVGFRGPTGGGKSTVAGIIAGLHRPWSGSVALNGRALSTLSTDELASIAALVDKTIFLFDGTVRENLRLWDETVSDETLWQAVCDAGLQDVLAQRGEGLDCRVLERGLNFSGGQRQRLEIARALVRNPALLILDEANDALEVALEEQVMANVRRRGCTVVIITHREETLQRCDEVFSVVAGRIASPADEREVTTDSAAAMANPQDERPILQEELVSDTSIEENNALLATAFSLVLREMGAGRAQRAALATAGGMAVYELARHHQVLVRRLLLVNKNWWLCDGGPLLAFWGERKRPVALIPIVGGGYTMRDPMNETEKRLTGKIAAQLGDEVFMLYRRLPDGPQRVRDFLRFSLHKAQVDMASIAVTGLFATGLALLWPLVAQRLFAAEGAMVPALGILLLAGLASAFSLAASHIAQARLFARAAHQLATAFWDRVVRLPVAAVRKNRAEMLGQTAHSVSTGIEHIREAVDEGWLALPLCAYWIALCAFSFTWALCVAGALLPAVVAAIYLTVRMARLEPLYFDRAVRSSAFLFDFIRGLRRLRAANSRWKTLEKWQATLRERLRIEGQISRLAHIRDAAIGIAPLLCIAGFVAGLVFDAEAVATTGEKIGASVAIAGMATSLCALLRALIALLMGGPLGKRVAPVLAEPTEAFVLARKGEGKSETGRCDQRLRGDLVIRHVTYSYAESAAPAVVNASLQIPAGKIVVISGPSGCGKSTLLRIAMGYIQPQQGQVLYDDVALGDWNLQVLRGQMGAVLQEDALWDGILRNNIAGMAPFSLDEVWAALRLVDLDRDVDKMPRKVNTFAGEATLSTGQKQRLVMARQLIRQPRLLILDEATSALDEVTEARVFANLRRLNMTCICVAHRESTLAHADVIYRMRAGRIIACEATEK
jgi:ABC-type bacteriocin/lantibiotic exporter with double-glycine peptidase domain